MILAFTLLPISALAAAEGAPSSLYVGNYQITKSDTPTYLKAGSTEGSLTEGDENDWTVKYDPSTAILTLSGATIQGGSNIGPVPFGSGIYAQGNSNQPVALTIELIGTNTITGYYGIYVKADQGTTPGADASLVIKNNGENCSLTVTGTGNSGLLIISGSGNASLTINDASVVASSNGSYGCAGVCVQSGASATGSPNISLAVNGGSLTASGTGSSDGILFYVGQSQATGANTSLTVSNNAIVDARNGGISASRISVTLPTPTPTGDNRSGIVFDGSTGTVYGTVELQNDLTINEGETLTVPDGSSLNCNGNLTNNGTINVESGGNLEGEPTSGTGTVVSAPKITTESLASGTVGAAYSQTLQADNAPTQWSITSGSLPDGLNLSGSTISGTPTTAGSSTFTVKAENSAGSDSKELTIQIAHQPTAITIQPADVSVQEGQTATFTVGATGESLSYQWQQSTDSGSSWTDIDGATAASYTTAATTMNMNGCQYCCKVTGADNQTVTSNAATLTVTPVPVTGVKLDKETLELYTGGSATLTATVQPSDATNQNVTWQSDNAKVATVENGVVTAKGAGTTTITVQTQDGNHTATCTVTVTQSTYRISANPSALDFGSVYTGYTRPDAKTVTITNTGNRPQSLTQPASTDNFEVGNLTKTELAVDETATFTVRPKADLPVGTYSENITVSGTASAAATISVRFTVTEPYEPEPEPEPTYFTLDFDDHPCEGVTLNSNLTAVEEGGTLYLYVEKEDEELYDYDNMRIYAKRGVNADWEELTEDPKRPGVYPIEHIWSDIFIKVEGVTPKDPTAIERVETLRIYATGDLLHVETPTRQRVTIVSMAGALIADGEQEGARIYRDLNAGVYIVRVGDYATKVRVE